MYVIPVLESLSQIKTPQQKKVFLTNGETRAVARHQDTWINPTAYQTEKNTWTNIEHKVVIQTYNQNS